MRRGIERRPVERAGGVLDFGAWLFRPPAPGDAEAFAADMREADRRELRRWNGCSPEYELRRAFDLADAAWVGCLPDGTPVSAFGGRRVNLVDATGCIWELSAKPADAHRTLFARASLAGFDLTCRTLPDVREFLNFVDSEYAAAARWVRWLGGRMDGEGFDGRCGGRFLRFRVANPHFREEDW